MLSKADATFAANRSASSVLFPIEAQDIYIYIYILYITCASIGNKTVTLLSREINFGLHLLEKIP